MSTYIAAYDTESSDCLLAVRKIVEIHRKYRMPATFFILARLLERQGNEYRSLIGDDPLFEIASHSYTHMLLRDHRVCGKAGPKDRYEHEIVESRQRIQECFGCDVAGFRPPVGSFAGLRGALDVLALCRKAGYRYCSSLLWGPAETMPALLREPFTYAEEGFPDILEVPACGWHENVLKGTTTFDPPVPLQLFPHPMPEAALTCPVKTPREEFGIHRLFVDRAVRTGAGYVSLIWHPWSLHRFDPQMKMLEWLFEYVGERELPVATFAGYVRTLE
jgi:peptidoglycan/xylan/chitin deacetylase (PgdA/CDA1 family)